LFRKPKIIVKKVKEEIEEIKKEIRIEDSDSSENE
jgi:hypothetical protein